MNSVRMREGNKQRVPVMRTSPVERGLSGGKTNEVKCSHSRRRDKGE